MKFISHLSPLALGESRVGHFAYDGTYYYFTVFSEDFILQTTEDFCLVGKIPTCRVYDCLCFDVESCCFWATVAGSARRLFQLDTRLREIGCRSLHHQMEGRITGLSYLSCDDNLLVAYPTALGIYEKSTEIFHPLPSVSGLVTAICAICPGYLVVSRRGKEQTLHIYFDNGEKISETTLSLEAAVQGICYNPCHCATPRLDILLRERCCYSKITSLPLSIHDLGFQPCICNHKICQHCCDAPPSCTPIDDVLESIALVEAALSHILNAQGEELQKVVAECDNIEEMLVVNQEINKTITKVTHLEQVLYNKLEELNELQGGTCAPPRSCDNQPLLE